jgi:alpha-tubulin suppressor-like RCC1 family protein
MALQDDINNFGASNTAAELLVLAAQTANTTNNRIVSVATVNDLPDLNNNSVELGTVFYVESIKTPVVAQLGCWSGLDNRELRNDFDVSLTYAWGSNSFGQLGDNSTVSRSSPGLVVGDFSDWCQVSAGNGHSLGVRCNGTAWAWGSNPLGELGDNTITSRSSPGLVVGGFTDWCQVAVGGNHSLGVRCNGTAWAWGNNAQGQLGDNTATSRLSPVSVVGGFTDWCQVSAGNSHSLGVRSNGTAWAWGYNNFGNLGDNTITNRSSPVSVVGGFTDWCQVSGGGNQSLGVRTNGTIWAWGRNDSGNLGDNTTTSRSSPVSVVGGFTDWCRVSGGGTHSLGLRTNGTLWAWGYNGQGRLGDNTTTSRTSPVSVVGGFTDWCQVSGGGCHSLGLRTNGTAWAWGSNANGRLGDNTTTQRLSPVSIVGGFTDWCQVSAGGFHSLAIRKFT